MSTESGRVRASDAEREEFATVVREAVGEGRLSLAEGDERLATIYAVTYRDELRPLITDLPAGLAATAPVEPAGQRGPHRGHPAGSSWGPPGGRPWGPPHRRGLDGPTHPRAFGFHLLIVLVVSLALVGLWSLGGAGFFWPAFPLIFFGLGLVRHARWRAYRRQ